MMTVLSGLLLLLCVEYCLANKNYAGYQIPNNLAFGRYTRYAKVDGSLSSCYKNFTNLVLDKWSGLGILSRVFDPILCDEICEQTKNCRLFQVISGVDYGEGCNLFRANANAKVTPMYTGKATCPAEEKGCVTRDVSYDRKHRIFIKKEARKKYYPRGLKTAGCQRYCKNFSGDNGFRFEDIDWRLTDKSLKNIFPDGKVPCAFYTYYTLDFYERFCHIFAEGASFSYVTKIAGPTSKCREDREAELQKGLSNPDFLDYTGRVFDKSQAIKNFDRVKNPEICRAKCQDYDNCRKSLTVIGMPENGGCWLFPEDTNDLSISIKSGKGNCPVENPGCVANDVSYGHAYQIVLRPEFEFKGSGIKDCQNFCGTNSGNPKGFPLHYLDWRKSGFGIKRNWYYSIPCDTYTYIDNPWFGDQCKIFIKGASQQNVLHKFGATSKLEA